MRRDWTNQELDLIVADYFAMLADEVAGRDFNKSAHRRRLLAQIDRTHGSIERKHMNISAALEALEMQRIDGYAPNDNFQMAIIPAITRYLDAHPVLAFEEPARAGHLAEERALFLEAAPVLRERTKVLDPRLAPLVAKHDQAQRDARNRALGRAGEALVFEFEKRRLHDAGHSKLAQDVRWVADLEGDGHGYDILSFAPSGEKRLIEVKTTRGGATTPFFLTRNEERVSREQETFRLYRLYDFDKTPRLFELEPPLRNSVVLETETWRAGFA